MWSEFFSKNHIKPNQQKCKSIRSIALKTKRHFGIKTCKTINSKNDYLIEGWLIFSCLTQPFFSWSILVFVGHIWLLKFCLIRYAIIGTENCTTGCGPTGDEEFCADNWVLQQYNGIIRSLYFLFWYQVWKCIIIFLNKSTDFFCIKTLDKRER